MENVTGKSVENYKSSWPWFLTGEICISSPPGFIQKPGRFCKKGSINRPSSATSQKCIHYVPWSAILQELCKGKKKKKRKRKLVERKEAQIFFQRNKGDAAPRFFILRYEDSARREIWANNKWGIRPRYFFLFFVDPKWKINRSANSEKGFFFFKLPARGKLTKERRGWNNKRSRLRKGRSNVWWKIKRKPGKVREGGREGHKVGAREWVGEESS